MITCKGGKFELKTEVESNKTISGADNVQKKTCIPVGSFPRRANVSDIPTAVKDILSQM